MTRRLILFGTLLVSALALGGSFLYQSLAQAEEGYARALADLGQCRRLQQRIQSLRESRASDPHSQRKLTELAPYLQDVAVKSGLNPENIVYIEPGASEQVADGSSYVKQALHIQLDRVMLPALGMFTKNLEAAGGDIRVAALRLSGPRASEATTEEWNCQMTLTCFLFSPIGAVPTVE